MTTDTRTPTLDQLRDWHARRMNLRSFAFAAGKDMAWAEQQWDEESFRTRDENGTHPFPATLDGANSAMPEVAVLDRKKGTAVCGHCAHQLGGSYPPLGSRCQCSKASVKIEWYRDHPATGKARMWGATAGDTLLAATPDTGDEIHNRYLLAKLACEAIDGRAP